MNLDITKIRLLIATALMGQTARWIQDEKRVRLFIAATQKKAIDIALSGDLNSLQGFAVETGALASAGVLIAQKMQFPKDGIRMMFGWDPYRDWRNDVRAFAANWNLDSVFVQEMGPLS